ncbi:MAG TPA: hypothetical protein DCR93_21760 [Cytophagales bacterium]|nr:hypothetical protein [Cytophagales bacterium]
MTVDIITQANPARISFGVPDRLIHELIEAGVIPIENNTKETPFDLNAYFTYEHSVAQGVFSLPELSVVGAHMPVYWKKDPPTPGPDLETDITFFTFKNVSKTPKPWEDIFALQDGRPMGSGNYPIAEVPFLYEQNAVEKRIDFGPPEPNQQREGVPFMALPYSQPQDPPQYLALCFTFSVSFGGKTYYGKYDPVVKVTNGGGG